MNATTVIPTDLLTPLGAYLRLREGGRRELPARVGRAGPARPPLVRRLRLAARRLRGGGGAAARRSSATSPTTTSRKLEPTVPLPDDGPRRCRRAASSSPTRSSASTTRSGIAEVLCGDPDEIAALLEGPRPEAARARRARAGQTRRFPSRHEYERGVRRAKEHIRAGDAFQIVLSQRAERPTSATALDALPRAAPRQPVAVPLPARARRPRAGRLLARDARQGRGPARER